MVNTVTVLGAHAATVTLGYDSPVNAALAQLIANAITSGIQGTSIVPADHTSGNQPPPLPPGKSGEWVQNVPSVGLVTLPKGYDAFVAPSFFDVFANVDVGQNFLAGTANGTMISSGANASGNVVMGGGNDDIIIRATDHGAWLIDLGNGQDTVQALGSGNDTISVGSGADSIFLGTGHNAVTTGGAATISASADTISGNDTITGLGTTVIYGHTSNITFLAGGGATVFGGSGSDTVIGGGGPDFFQGGTAGNNVLTAGVGAATLMAGGGGDQLFANGNASQILYAASGNETLSGSSVSGASDTFVGGTGHATVMASTSDSNLFEFIHNTVGNTFVSGLNDIGQVHLHLSGFGANDITSVASQNNGGGSLNVTLTDGTQITFTNVTNPLTNSNFS